MHAPDRSLMRAFPARRAAGAFVALLGLLYASQVADVLRHAIGAPTQSARPGTVLVLGKRLVDGQLDLEFQARLARADALLAAAPARALLLSGGGAPGRTEADVALAALRAAWAPGTPVPGAWRLETRARDTRENLAFSRPLLAEGDRVSVVSSRTHLARVRRLAHAQGWDVELVAAEDRLPWTPATAVAVLREAAYLGWTRRPWGGP